MKISLARMLVWPLRALRASACGLVLVGTLSVAEQILDEHFPYPLHVLGRYGTSVPVYSADGDLLRLTAIGQYERLLPVDYVPRLLRDALVASEDQRYFGHSGVDFFALSRAVGQVLWHGRVVSGASTLTMQAVRIAEPRPRVLQSKLVEVFRARQLEGLLDKESILRYYVDHAPLGGVLRGFGAAAIYWFGCSAEQLSAAEAATLVAMLPAPSLRAPDKNPDGLLRERNQVLGRMWNLGFLTRAEHGRAVRSPLGAVRHPWPFHAPHACDHLLARKSAGVEGGSGLATDIDLDLHREIRELVASHDTARVDGVAVVVVDRRTGAVEAMVGSSDYREVPLNAATCRRSAGSTLKPFLYALAMEQGVIHANGLISDRPGKFGDYRPANFDREYRGEMQVDEALATSRNLPAVRLLAAVGTDEFRDLLFRLGLAPDYRAVTLDAALGTCAVSPLELAQAYARMCSQPARVGLSAPAVDQVIDAMSRHALAGAPRDIAWKTGTSSGRRDAWCVGVLPKRVIVVWLGNLSGRGDPDLVGVSSAGRLLAEVALLCGD